MSDRDFVPVMRQDWRELLFLHWRVEPAQIAARLPSPLEVDTFEGEAFVGLVPFRVEHVRPPLVPRMPPAPSFPEVNVRTYVRLPGHDPGVWFFSLDADHLPAVVGARLLYHLPYVASDATLAVDGERVRFESRRRDGSAQCRAVWQRDPASVTHAAPGSLAEFLVERYVLYAAHDGHLDSARVAHGPYPLVPAQLLELADELVAAAGLPVAGEPLVHCSLGVEVSVSALRRVTARA